MVDLTRTVRCPVCAPGVPCFGTVWRQVVTGMDARVVGQPDGPGDHFVLRFLDEGGGVERIAMTTEDLLSEWRPVDPARPSP
jgi:hypothetical protein